MPKKKPKDGDAEVHKDLKGFDIKINEFGQITTNFDVEKINDFLDDNVEDKKLSDRKEKLTQEEEE
ncbi:MAG: hypothetical protein AAGH79_15535 [Bacteroidota bacterium]